MGLAVPLLRLLLRKLQLVEVLGGTLSVERFEHLAVAEHQDARRAACFPLPYNDTRDEGTG